MTVLLVCWLHPFAGTSRSRRRTRSSQRLQAPAEHRRSGLKQVAECGSSGQSAITSSFQLTAIFGKLSPRKAAAASNPHSRPTAHHSPAGSFIAGFRTPAPYTGPIARAGPASETLHESGHPPDRGQTPWFDPEPTFASSPADRWVYREAVIRTTRISSSRQLVEQRLRLSQI